MTKPKWELELRVHPSYNRPGFSKSAIWVILLLAPLTPSSEFGPKKKGPQLAADHFALGRVQRAFFKSGSSSAVKASAFRNGPPVSGMADTSRSAEHGLVTAIWPTSSRRYPFWGVNCACNWLIQAESRWPTLPPQVPALDSTSCNPLEGSALVGEHRSVCNLRQAQSSAALVAATSSLAIGC